MDGEAINFLRKRRQKVQQYRRLDRRILQGSIGATLASILLVGGAFAYTQIQERSLVQIQDRQRAALSLVNQQASNEASYLLFAARLNILKDILPGRSSQRQAMLFLGELASSDIAFDRISYDDNQKIIIFRVKAQNVLAVEKFLDRLRAPQTREKFFSLVLSDVKRDEGQIYSMEITVNLEAPVRKGSSG